MGLTGVHIFNSYSETNIREFASSLKSDNLILIAMSKTFEGETDKVEPLYQIKHSIERIRDFELKRFSNPPPISTFSLETQSRTISLALPQANILIPTNFKIHG